MNEIFQYTTKYNEFIKPGMIKHHKTQTVKQTRKKTKQKRKNKTTKQNNTGVGVKQQKE